MTHNAELEKYNVEVITPERSEKYLKLSEQVENLENLVYMAQEARKNCADPDRLLDGFLSSAAAIIEKMKMHVEK